MTISLRISEVAFKALQEDAKRHNISINTLANQLFLTYAQYDRFLDRFHMIKLSNPTFKKILNAATHDEIVQAGRAAGSSLPPSFILAEKGELNLANAVDYLRTMGTYANLFDYGETLGSGVDTITLTHDLGPNGSVFLANYVDALLKPLGKAYKIIELPDAVTIKF